MHPCKIALVAWIVGAAAVLGHGLHPLLTDGAPRGGFFALVRYEGWMGSLLAVQLLSCTSLAVILR